MYLDLNAVAATQVAQHTLFLFNRFDAFLLAPLKWRVRLGHKVRGRAGDLDVLVEPPAAHLAHTPAQLGDAAHILFGFGRQANHEIHLHGRPALFKCHGARFHHVVFGDVLVDDIAHALSAGFGRNRKTGFADAGDLARQGFLHSRSAQGRD